MERTLTVMESASIVDLRRFDLNRGFHTSIARASGNQKLDEMISDVLRQSNTIGFKEVLDDQDFSDREGRPRNIFQAMVKRDPKAAREAVVSHFDRMRRSRAVS